MRRPVIGAVLLVALAAAPVVAEQKQTPQLPAPQKPKVPKQYRGFIALGGGLQAAAAELSDGFTFDAHSETGNASVDYAAKAAPTADVAVGRRFWKTGGLAVGFSRSSSTGTAQVDAAIPHPFFDERDRDVSGEAGAIGRAETSAHLQLFWMREHGKWRTRVLGGLTYFSVRQDVVTAVNVTETYPYDAAEFRSVTTGRGSGTGVGFNAGVDLAWMFTPRWGWGGAARFTRGTVDLNVTGGRTVSTDAGGAQAVAGVRIAF